MYHYESGVYCGGNYMDLLDPYWPAVPLTDPTGANERKHTLEVWLGLHRQPTTAFEALLCFEPDLFLATFRRIYGRTPDANQNGEYTVSRTELIEMTAALWPSVREHNWFYQRRCKAAKALKALRAKK